MQLKAEILGIDSGGNSKIDLGDFEIGQDFIHVRAKNVGQVYG